MAITSQTTDHEKIITHWLTEFTKLSNQFYDKGDKELSNYWKGQVMGICKVVDELKLPIHTQLYLQELY